MTEVGLIFFYSDDILALNGDGCWILAKPEFRASWGNLSPVFLVIYWKVWLSNMCQTLKRDGKYFRFCSLTSLEPVFFPLSPSPIVPDRRVMIGCCHNRQTKPLVCVFSPLEKTGSATAQTCNLPKEGAWMRGSITKVWVWRCPSGEGLLFGRLWRVSCDEVMAKPGILLKWNWSQFYLHGFHWNLKGVAMETFFKKELCWPSTAVKSNPLFAARQLYLQQDFPLCQLGSICSPHCCHKTKFCQQNSRRMDQDNISLAAHKVSYKG